MDGQTRGGLTCRQHDRPAPWRVAAVTPLQLRFWLPRRGARAAAHTKAKKPAVFPSTALVADLTAWLATI